MFDDTNTINEKAVIGFASFLMMVLFAIIDIVMGILGQGLKLNNFIYQSFEILTIACFGIASLDKWINKKG